MFERRPLPLRLVVFFILLVTLLALLPVALGAQEPLARPSWRRGVLATADEDTARGVFRR